MKKNFIKTCIAVAICFAGLKGSAQCPTFSGINVTNGQNGTATLMAVSSTSVFPAGSSFYWQMDSNITVLLSSQFYQQLQFPANGTYTVCMSYNDSITMCSATQCTVVTISNLTLTPCNAGYTYYNDSLCQTHFWNTSTGANLSYQWYDMQTFNLLSTLQNPVLNLGAGSRNIGLYTYSNSQFCDSLTMPVNVSCSGTYTCSAAFSAVTQGTSCVTNFINASTGSNLTYQWYEMPSFNLLSTQQNPSLNLANGTHYIALYTLSNGQFCDSVVNTVAVNCFGNSNCNANSQFLIFADSLNPGSYFAYNQSTGTGNVTYTWNFGDGSTSTQQYPFHQYAVPGQYVVCLTVSATIGTATCTDTYCDSSSVHRIASGFLMSKIQVKPQGATGIKSQDTKNDLRIFPNPVENELHIVIDGETNSVMHYTITDALGNIVTTNALINNMATYDTSNLSKGIYFVNVTDANNSVIKTSKLIK